jgi:hypothetical protein
VENDWHNLDSLERDRRLVCQIVHVLDDPGQGIALLRRCRFVYVQRREQAIRFPVDKVADHYHVQTVQTDFAVASLLDVSEIARVTHTVRWQSVLLAGTAVGWTLALPNSDASFLLFVRGVVCLTLHTAYVRRLCPLFTTAHAHSLGFLALVLALQTLALRNSIPALAGFTSCDTAQCAPMETMRADAALPAELSNERAG